MAMNIAMASEVGSSRLKSMPSLWMIAAPPTAPHSVAHIPRRQRAGNAGRTLM
jgi:hypothetical protein